MADFRGDAGDDIFAATLERDKYFGGEGFDTVSFLFEGGPAGVSISLTTGSGVDTFGNQNEVFDSIERVEGTQNNDSFLGDSRDNTFIGFAGNDAFDGSVGFDTVDFTREPELGGSVGVSVNLTTGLGTDSFGDADTFANIERIIGTSFNDTLTGSAGRDTLVGGDGNDVLDGGNDADTLIGGNGDDMFTAASDNVRGFGDLIRPGAGTNTVEAGVVTVPGSGRRAGHDLSFIDIQSGVTVNTNSGTATASGMSTTFSNVDSVEGSGFADSITGGVSTFDAIETFVGFAGNDTINGGSGRDEVRYDLEVSQGYLGADGNAVRGTSGIQVDLEAQTATDSYGDSDRLFGIEEVTGTPFDDQIRGSATGTNVLVGLGGNDRLDGGRGGFNIVTYERDAGAGGNLAVQVNLAVGQARDGFGNTDTLVNVTSVRATRGDDVLIGNAFRNELVGLDGTDFFITGSGNDVVNGGGGFDTMRVEAFSGGGFDLFRLNDTVYAVEAGGTVDIVREVEQFESQGKFVQFAALRTFDAARYVAADGDRIREIGLNEDAALDSFLTDGPSGDERGFDAGQYLANYADLRAAFGSDEGIATRHFVGTGAAEGRLAEDPLDYIASFADLIGAYRLEADLIGVGLNHFRFTGVNEDRREGIDFDPVQYLANYADLRAAFGQPSGGNGGAAGDRAAEHFIRAGFNEGRLWEDPLAYIASYDDLIVAFRGAGGIDDVRAAGLSHFQLAGFNEGRRPGIDFDAGQYLENYADLRAAFADGVGGFNEEAATLHFITNGFAEGRTDSELI